MQGAKVGPITAGLMTPESLGELMGGPDIPPVQSNLQTPPGYPNAYDEQPGPLPYIGQPDHPAPIHRRRPVPTCGRDRFRRHLLARRPRRHLLGRRCPPRWERVNETRSGCRGWNNSEIVGS